MRATTTFLRCDLQCVVPESVISATMFGGSGTMFSRRKKLFNDLVNILCFGIGTWVSWTIVLSFCLEFSNHGCVSRASVPVGGFLTLNWDIGRATNVVYRTCYDAGLFATTRYPPPPPLLIHTFLAPPQPFTSLPSRPTPHSSPTAPQSLCRSPKPAPSPPNSPPWSLIGWGRIRVQGNHFSLIGVRGKQ